MRIAILLLLAAEAARAVEQNAGMALQYGKSTWPISIVDRPLVVAPGMTEIQVNMDKEFSADSFSISHPLTSQLFVRHGVSDRCRSSAWD
jgi:hypothetical protein